MEPAILTEQEQTIAIDKITRWSATGTGDVLELVGLALAVIRSNPTEEQLRRALNFYGYVQKYIWPSLEAAQERTNNHVYD